LKLSPKVSLITLVLLLASFAAAETLTGVVKNGTSNKPSAGDEVVLLKLSQGMEEAGRTKTDSQGKFSFKLNDATSPHLVRVIHQDVTYHRMAPPGTPSVDVEVYDVAKKIEGLSTTADVMRFQAQDGQIQGVRLFAVDNNSVPPRTQMNDAPFEFMLPDGAVVDTGMAKTAGGQPIQSAPVPQKAKNKYAFIFPLRPGETQFQVVYHMPYSGALSIDPKLPYGAQHFVVMLPKSMHFTPGPGANFQPMQDPQQSEAIVEVASNTKQGDPLSFKISGTGVLESGDNQAAAAGGGGAPAAGSPEAAGPEAAASQPRPGGGLGPPIDAPDPLDKYRWYILGGFGALLVAGGIYIATRSKTVPDFAAEDDITRPAAAAKTRGGIPPVSGNRSDLLLEALKEELFQLELDHQQGRMTGQEYAKAKAALDETLSRALKRQSVKA
jgi:hypothetical protein